jgi:molecular chaperone GrpE (heat shock protein)
MADEGILTPEVSEGPTSISDALENYDFDWDSDDGELTVSRTEEESEEESTEEESEETEEESTEEESEEEESEEETKETKEAPSAELLALKAQIAALEQKLEAKGDEQKATKEEPASDPLADVIPEDADLAEIFTDVEQTKTLLKEAFVTMIEKTLVPYQTMLQHYTVTQEIRAAFQKYPDFEDKLPHIRDILAEQPDLDLDTAYSLVSKFAPAKPAGEASKEDQSETTAESEKAKASKEKATPQLSVEELKEKAAKLKTEQGVSGKRTSDGPATTVQEAFDNAVDEVLG